MPEDKLKKFYSSISKEYDLPDYETFSKDMADPVKREKLYSAVSKSYELPDFDTFTSDMGLKKKDNISTSSQSGIQENQEISTGSASENGNGGIFGKVKSVVADNAAKAEEHNSSMSTDGLVGEEGPELSNEIVAPNDGFEYLIEGLDTAKLDEEVMSEINTPKNRKDQIAFDLSIKTKVAADRYGLNKEQYVNEVSNGNLEGSVIYDKQNITEPIVLSKEGKIDLLNGIVGTLSHRPEFEGKNFEDLAPDQQRVVLYEFSSRYLAKDDVESYMKDSNMDTETGGVSQVLGSLAKGGLGIFSGVGDFADAASDKLSGTSLNSEVERMKQKAYYGAITEKEYNEWVSNISKRIPKEDKDNPYLIIPKYEQVSDLWINMWNPPSAGDKVRDVSNYLPSNPNYQGDFLMDVLPQGVGSMAAFMASGGAKGAALLGATSNGGSMYKEAIDNGATEEDAYKAMFLGAGIGASESITLGKYFKRFNGRVGNSFRARLTKVIKEGTEEGLQEVFTDAANNLTAQQLYDETREIINDESLESFFVGQITGSLMTLATTKRESGDSKDKGYYDKAVDLIMDYRKNKDAENAPPINKEVKETKVSSEISESKTNKELGNTLTNERGEKVDVNEINENDIFLFKVDPPVMKDVLVPLDQKRDDGIFSYTGKQLIDAGYAEFAKSSVNPKIKQDTESEETLKVGDTIELSTEISEDTIDTTGDEAGESVTPIGEETREGTGDIEDKQADTEKRRQELESSREIETLYDLRKPIAEDSKEIISKIEEANELRKNAQAKSEQAAKETDEEKRIALNSESQSLNEKAQILDKEVKASRDNLIENTSIKQSIKSASSIGQRLLGKLRLTAKSNEWVSSMPISKEDFTKLEDATKRVTVKNIGEVTSNSEVIPDILLIEEINAKYDAELKALEQTKAETKIEPTREIAAEVKPISEQTTEELEAKKDATEVEPDISTQIREAKTVKEKIALKRKAAKEAKVKAEKSKKEEVESDENVKFAEDEAENRAIEESLDKEDNVEQEPAIQAIESKAESSSEAELNEAVAEIDAKVGEATGISKQPVNSITTREGTFQNRDGLNEDKVNEIAENWDDTQQDPVHYWVDPETNEKIVISGHHRLAAAQKAGRDNILAREYKGTLDQAVKFAKEEANANRTMETPLERAKLLKEKRDRGDKDLDKFLKSEGKNARKVENLSHLNPKGKAVSMMQSLANSQDVDTQQRVAKIADWIGDARKAGKVLTDAHENEMYDFLMDAEASKRFTSKANFTEAITALRNDKNFDPSKPLGVKKFSGKGKSDTERTYDTEFEKLNNEQKELQQELNEINERLNNPLSPKYVATTDPSYDSIKRAADKKIADVNAQIKRVKQDKEKLKKRKGDVVRAAANQNDLFGGSDWGSNNTRVTTERANELREQIRKSRGNANIGLSPQDLAALVELGIYHLEAGARKLADFAKAMRVEDNRLTDAQIESLYNEANADIDKDGKELADLYRDELSTAEEFAEATGLDQDLADRFWNEQTDTKESEGPEQKKLSYIKRVMKSYKGQKELLDAVEAEGTTYETVSHKKVNPMADKIMDEALAMDNPDAAFDAISDSIGETTEKDYRTNLYLPTLQSLLAHKIINYYYKTGDVKKFAKWSKRFAETGRSFGQFNSAMQNSAAPEALVNNAIASVQEGKSEALIGKEEEVQELQDFVEKILEEKAREIAKSDKLAEKLKEAVAKSKNAEKRAERAASGSTQRSTKQKAKSLADKIRSHKTDPSRFMFSQVVPITPVYDLALEIAAQVVDKGGTLIHAIEMGLKHLKKSKEYQAYQPHQQAKIDGIFDVDFKERYTEHFEESGLEWEEVKKTVLSKVKKSFESNENNSGSDVTAESIATAIFGKAFRDNETPNKSTKGKVDPLEVINQLSDSKVKYDEIFSYLSSKLSSDELAIVKERYENNLAKLKERAARNFKKEIKKLIEDHFIKGNIKPTALADVLIEKLGLDRDSANLIQDDIVSEIQKELDSRLKKKFGLDKDGKKKDKKAKKQATVVDSILKSIQYGALDQGTFQNHFAEKYGFANISPEQVAKLEEIIGYIFKYNGSEMSYRYKKKLADFVAAMAPMDSYKFFTIVEGLRIRAILSGFRTRFANITVGSMLGYTFGALPRYILNARGYVAARKAWKEAGLKGTGRETFWDIYKTGFNMLDLNNQKFEDKGIDQGDALAHYFTNRTYSEIYADQKNPIMGALAVTGRTIMRMFEVSNFASAFDAIMTHKGAELEQFIEEYNKVFKEKGGKVWRKNSKDIVDTVRKNLNYNKIDKLKKEVDEEIKQMKADGDDIPKGHRKRRMLELMHEGRDSVKVLQAKEMMQQYTYMNTPDGALSKVHRVWSEKFKIKTSKEDKATGGAKFSKDFTKFILNAGLGTFMRMGVVTTQAMIRNFPVIGLAGLIYKKRVQKVVDSKGVTAYKFEKMSKRQVNHRIVEAAITHTIMGLVMTNMYNWDDEENEFKLNPDRMIEVTGNGDGDFWNRDFFRSKDSNGDVDDISPYTLRLKVNGDWINVMQTRFIPQLMTMGAILGGIRDREYLEEKGLKFESPKDALKISNDAIWDMAYSTTEQSFNNFPKFIKKGMFSAFKGKDGGSEAFGGMAADMFVKPVKSVLFPNVLRDTYFQGLALIQARERTGTSFNKSLSQNLYGLEYLSQWGNMIDVTDAFGNEIIHTSPISETIMEYPIVPEFINEYIFSDYLLKNNDRFNQPEWDVHSNFPGVIVPSFRPEGTEKEKMRKKEVYKKELGKLVRENASELSYLSRLEYEAYLQAYSKVAKAKAKISK